MQLTDYYDVIVVGAGLSGLRAAVTVHEAGLSCLVLEANDRIGGKVLSAPNPSGADNTVDLGAAWINDTNQSHIYALAQKYGAEFEKQFRDGDTIVEKGDGTVLRMKPDALPGTPEQQQELLQLIGLCYALGEQLKKEDFIGDLSKQLDQITLATWVQQQTDNSELASALLNFLIRAIVGADADEVSALFVLKYIEAATGFENIAGSGPNGGQYLRPKQGSILYVNGLASSLTTSSICLSTPVTGITQTSRHVTVTTSAHPQPFHASKVIVSTPTPLYKHITFLPPLPQSKQTLTNTTHLGYYSKLIASYSTPWWRTAGLTGETINLSSGPITMILDTSVLSQHQYSLSMFLLGRPGQVWSKLPTPAARRSAALTHLHKLFGAFVDEVPEPLGTIEKEWSKDKWFEGAPSTLYPLGGLTIDAGRSLRERFGHVHFVGTEMSEVWEGYMEGAVREGERGGLEVVRALKA